MGSEMVMNMTHGHPNLGTVWLVVASLCAGGLACGAEPRGAGDVGGGVDAEAGLDGGSNPGSGVVVSREVTLNVGDLVLEGTLSIPAHAKGTRVPGLVLVHGTGSQSREETASGQQGLSFGVEYGIFHDLADLLVSKGYAVLRYDKRSCGAFNNRCKNHYPSPSREYTVDDFVSDGAKVANFLASQPEIDPARVAVAGHSQGGALIPAILTAAPGVAAGVVIAGPWHTLDIVARWQYDAEVKRLKNAGATLAEIEADTGLQDLDALATAFEHLRKGQPWPGAPFGSEHFWQIWLDMDVARPGLAAALARPLLAVSGDYDWNVGVAETKAWEEAGVATAVILPGITHGLNYIKQPDYLKLKTSDIGHGVHHNVSDAIADFLDKAMPEG